MLKKIKENKLLTFGIILLIMGVVIYTTSLIINKISESKELSRIDEFIESTDDINQNMPVLEEKRAEQATDSSNTINYSMIVEISRIGLKKGLFEINSKYNDINYNIAILSESDMPNITNGTLILASHNGNSNISYFRNLNKLQINDSVEIYYKGIKYVYKIVNYYEAQKTGSIVIKTESNKTSIALISCKPNTHDMQIVYIGELESKGEY
jgi:LPXTG-site transpeptidase (sortase) family protein